MTHQQMRRYWFQQFESFWASWRNRLRPRWRLEALCLRASTVSKTFLLLCSLSLCFPMVLILIWKTYTVENGAGNCVTVCVIRGSKTKLKKRSTRDWSAQQDSDEQNEYGKLPEGTSWWWGFIFWVILYSWPFGKWIKNKKGNIGILFLFFYGRYIIGYKL